mmetsp:Transcript_126796/g.370661  ORF Transcript_126796/g.370661 Transcript_126796/m.370661 type:complete len:218 (+) Transcript_126796:1808-2461(+)
MRAPGGTCMWPRAGPWCLISTAMRCSSEAKGKRRRTCSLSAPLPIFETMMSGPSMSHRTAPSAAFSRGSPTTSPSTTVRPLHEAIKAVVRKGRGWSMEPLLPSALSCSASPAGSAGGGEVPSARPWTPATSMESLVRVPVLSKQQVSTLPARGTRKGSVQKILFWTRATKLRFTASESMMGNSGGTTDVMMWLTDRKSLKEERAGSSTRRGASTRPS